MKTSVRLPLVFCEDIKKIVEKLVELCGNNVQKIILFGSFATVSYQPDSDYDICIVLNRVPSSNSEKQSLRNIGEHCGIERNVDVVICSHIELETGKMVFKYIRRDGVLLYG